MILITYATGASEAAPDWKSAYELADFRVLYHRQIVADMIETDDTTIGDETDVSSL